MISTRPGPVVAGVDYSEASRTAVAYAAWEARRRGLELLLVHGFLGSAPDEIPQVALDDDNALVIVAEERLVEAAAALRCEYPGVRISTKVVVGSGGTTLVEESASASLVVVGPRGRGGFEGLLLGSVAAQVSTHARCPVVVVRPSMPSTVGDSDAAWVVVGIDSSAQSAQVLSFAFEEAAARGVGLLAVHVWSVPEMSALSFGTVWSRSPATARTQLHEAAERVLGEALVGWPQKYPEVEVKRLTVHGDDPADTLLETAGAVAAGLVVVGRRGRGGFAGKLLGSVSHAVAAHARASVAVIHPEANSSTHAAVSGVRTRGGYTAG
jgi:nucleotide-binding universal stress UspA family protein